MFVLEEVSSGIWFLLSGIDIPGGHERPVNFVPVERWYKSFIPETMKKFLFFPLFLFVLTATACGGASVGPEGPATEQPGTPGDDGNDDVGTPGDDGRYVVLYCSRTGNTESVARQIGTALGCDVVEVEPETPYDTDYDAMLERAQQEQASIEAGNFPSIKTTVHDFDVYDIVFVGYPVWYGHMAAPMQSFLHEHAVTLAGRRIALFATSGSSGISTSVGDARTHCPEAELLDPTLLLTSSSLSQTDTRVAAWLDAIGAGREESETSEGAASVIGITVGGRRITATMEDNAAARDLLSRLPLEVTLNDYNNTTEKIFYPDPALTLDGVPRGCAPSPGDITVYAPWGNVAIFCKSWPHSNDLIKIGRIDGEGIEALRVAGDIQVTFERQ